MSVRLEFDGLAELRAALRRLPDELAEEAGRIVRAAGDQAVADIGADYGNHRRSGNLADHLSVKAESTDRFGAAVVVRNTVRHAHLFDHGTEVRSYVEPSGAIHETGAMWTKSPPQHVFVRGMTRARAGMYRDLKALLARAGFEVIGDA